MTRGLFGPGTETSTATVAQERGAAQDRDSNSRAAAAATRGQRSIGGRGTHTRTGSTQARAAGRAVR